MCFCKYRLFLIHSRDSLILAIPNNKMIDRALTAESVICCNVIMNLDDFNISNKALFTLMVITYLLSTYIRHSI